jgi:hypothetical protein
VTCLLEHRARRGGGTAPVRPSSRGVVDHKPPEFRQLVLAINQIEACVSQAPARNGLPLAIIATFM